MTERFDNLSEEELLKREKEAFAEHKDILAAIEQRMLARCPIKTKKIYRVAEGRFKGRRFLVNHIRFQFDYYWDNEGCWVSADGVLERSRPAKIGARDGKFGYKNFQLDADRLDASTESDN